MYCRIAGQRGKGPVSVIGMVTGVMRTASGGLINLLESWNSMQRIRIFPEGLPWGVPLPRLGRARKRKIIVYIAISADDDIAGSTARS